MERLLTKDEIHQELLSMLDEMVAYFEKHNLRYYMVGGTLLGAVRHKGFIPWDDDIDLGMPRPDYERFLDLTKEEPIAPHIKVISGREGTFSLPFCEVINTKTRTEKPTEKYMRRECMVLNLFIDIMPQDGWPEDIDEAEKLFSKMKRDRYRIQNCRAKMGAGTSLFRAVAKIPMILYCRILGYKKIINKMDKISKSYDYDSSTYVGAITYGIYGVGERCRGDDTRRFEELDFEGRKLKAPGGWDKYLTQIFGDYMTLPPKEKQISHEQKVWKEE